MVIAVSEEVDCMLDGNAYKDLRGSNGISISCSKKYGHAPDKTSAVILEWIGTLPPMSASARTK